jgi:hypothetical protein
LRVSEFHRISGGGNPVRTQFCGRAFDRHGLGIHAQRHRNERRRYLYRASGGVTAGAVIERTQFASNTLGIWALGTDGPALVEVRYSSIANSVLDGILANTAGSTASIVVEHSASVQNGGSGINAQGAGAYVSLSDSTVDWNATGLSATGGGLILSYKNNMIAGNLSPGVTPLSFSLQ